MRLLFISNLFPPFANGGYEQLCHEVTVELRQRGHEVDVVTSVPQSSLAQEGETHVHRFLHAEVQGGLLHSSIRLLFHRRRLEAENLSRIRAIIADCRPDVALIWGMWNIPRSVPALIEELLPSRVAYYFCDYWPSLPSSYQQQWQNESRRPVTRLIKRLASKPFLAKLRRESVIPLRLQYPICVSRAVRELLVKDGIPVQHAKIVYLGTDPGNFVSVRRQDVSAQRDRPLKLLYAGRLTATKGVHTAIAALAEVISAGSGAVTLSILGKGERDYELYLQRMVEELQLAPYVSFLDKAPHAEMPRIMADHDVLVFPSEWEEPFARTILEAMATGLTVIGTTTGGTPEVLIHKSTGLTYPAGDARALAAQIQYLQSDQFVCRQLALAGQNYVLQRFTLQQTVDQLESILQTLSVSSPNPPLWTDCERPDCNGTDCRGTST